MALELQGDLASDLTARLGSETLLSVDPFELLTAETLCDWRALLNRIDLLFLGEDEMATAEDRRDPEPLLRGLLTDRLRTVFYKQGRRGGIACRADRDATTRWPARANRIADTTGAGDAFACGVLAGVLTDQPLTRALEWGVVSASFAIEGQGASGLLEATPTSARDRHYRWFGT